MFLLGLVTAASVSGLTIPKRQTTDTDNYTCGSNTYDADAINAAVSQGYSYLESGDAVGTCNRIYWAMHPRDESSHKDVTDK